jgi:CRISPR-associated protein Cas1
LGLDRAFVGDKICNQAPLLRRHAAQANEPVQRMRELQRRALTANSLTELLGLEGDAAARYFSSFDTMLSPRIRDNEDLRLITRTRRPARDPLNAALNFGYGLLVADLIRAVIACGLDPHAGFLHSSQRNKPALALDLCEEFRAPVADSVVISAFNNGEIRSRDFSDVTGSTRLRPAGRTALISAYERRVATEFTHPLFGYRVTWRRAMEIQARLVLGVVDGTQPGYRGIMTR